MTFVALASVWFRDMNHLPCIKRSIVLSVQMSSFSESTCLHEEHEGKTDEDEGQGHDR